MLHLGRFRWLLSRMRIMVSLVNNNPMIRIKIHFGELQHFKRRNKEQALRIPTLENETILVFSKRGFDSNYRVIIHIKLHMENTNT